MVQLKKWKNLKNDDILLFVILGGLFVFLSFAYILSAFRSMVNADAGYYLGVAELIHKGYIPYRDFSLSYTPLFFYALQLPRLFMGTYPDYSGYMAFLYLISALNAYLVAIIIKRITDNVKLAVLSALLFLLLYLYLDGMYFILETFSISCGLVSLTLLIGIDTSPLRSLISGIFCALAFLSKQYGLLFAGTIGVYLLLSTNTWRGKLLNCLSAFAGFCFIIAFFSSLLMLQGVSIKDLILELSGSTYGGQSLDMYVEGVTKSFKLFPFLLFVPYLLFNRNTPYRNLVWACCVGLLLASLQFYFNIFPHYYIYLIPFALVLSAMIWKQLRLHKRKGVSFLLYFGLLFTACAIPMHNVYKNTKAMIKHDLRADQNKTTVQLRETIRNQQLDSALCYWNTIQYYGLCPIEPSSMKDYGFSFGSDSEETYIERLNNSDCFLINKSDLESINSMKKLSQVLAEQFHILDIEFADGSLVFVRNL